MSGWGPDGILLDVINGSTVGLGPGADAIRQQPSVPVRRGLRDFAGVFRNLLIDDFLVLFLAPLEAVPGNHQAFLFFLAVAGNQNLQLGIGAYKAAQQGALVQILKHR
jgi:hypothetical protein